MMRVVGLLAVTAAIGAACDSPSVASSPLDRPWISDETRSRRGARVLAADRVLEEAWAFGGAGLTGRLPRR